MHRILSAGILLAVAATLALAQKPLIGTKPAFPHVAVGFEDYRPALLNEIEAANLDAGRHTQRVMEDWHRQDLARFVALHLNLEEREHLDKSLKLNGALGAAGGEAAVLEALARHKVEPKALAGVLGELLDKREYSAAEAAAWLYARDLNAFAQLKHAGNEALHCFSTVRALRELAEKGRGADEIFNLGCWEFDRRDGLLARGGHYDAVQLAEAVLALGMPRDTWAQAMKKKDAAAMGKALNTLIEWGDPVALAHALEGKLAEAELASAARAYLRREKNEGRALKIGLLCTRVLSRWFRTGGPGVLGVYSGPWPTAKDETLAVKAAEMPEDATLFAEAIDEPLRKHFAQGGDWLTLVLYDDGCARAVLRHAVTEFDYCPDAPLGAGKHKGLLYEGRAGEKARAGAFTLIFAPVGAKRMRIDLSALMFHAGGGLLAATVEDGTNMLPILLRRCSSLVALD